MTPFQRSKTSPNSVRPSSIRRASRILRRNCLPVTIASRLSATAHTRPPITREKGLAYKLAPLKGKQSKAMAALLLRGMLRGVSRSDLQMAAWYIQWGVPPSNMSPSAQLLIHTLIPEYEQSLEGDFLANIEATYNKYKLLRSDAVTQHFAHGETEAGRAVLEIRRARQTLSRSNDRHGKSA